MLYYILFIVIAILLLLVGYVKVKYGFWVSQPVFHIYDLSYMIFPPGIINHELPSKNKYTNFTDIQTYTYDELGDIQTNDFVNFIRMNYLKTKTNIFNPDKNNITPYFHGHNAKSFVSFFTRRDLSTDLKKGTIVEGSKIIGAMTSRPLHIRFRDELIDAYYVDYLCVDKSHRKSGIAPKIIQTHHYNQSHRNPNIRVSLFKREGELTGIVPLCVYDTYGFHVSNWRKPQDLHAMYSIVSINSQNYHLLLDFIQKNRNIFDVIITTEPSNIIELIKTGNIFINVIICKSEIICAYFFKRTCVLIDVDLSILMCFASINNCPNEDLFIHGFKISFWSISDQNNFGFSAIENISHNDIIIDNICKRTSPFVINPTAYFLYNYARHTVKPNRTIVIS